MSDTDLELLARYARHRAEDAFAEIVRRHLNLVHSAALRQVRSPQLAEEVAQSVFTDLARDARRLAPDTILTAWLYRVTRRTAIDVVRREARRQLREQIATEMNAMNATATDWTHIEPILDDAMHALDETDRTAVLLRYFENKSLREVGQALGASDDTAQKRVSRAVERLREFFAKRGVTIGTGGLAVVISSNAIQAAPTGLAVTISTAAALAGTTIVTTATGTATKVIAMTTLQKAFMAATLAVLAGTAIYEARQASRLSDEKQNLLAHQQLLTSERDKMLPTATHNTDTEEQLRRDKNELLRLRGETGVLRNQLSELQKLREQNRQLQALLAKAGQEAQMSPEEIESAKRQQKMIDTKTLALAMINYADRHQGRFPTNFSQVTHYFEQALRDALAEGDTLRDGKEVFQMTNRFDIVYQGSLQTDLGEVILLREKQAEFRNGKWVKVYGFCDGSARAIAEPEGGFDVWEAQHIVAISNTDQ